MLLQAVKTILSFSRVNGCCWYEFGQISKKRSSGVHLTLTERFLISLFK